MTYRVDTLDTIFDITEGDDPQARDCVRLEAALNAAEDAGWTLVQHVPQYSAWDDDGKPLGQNEQLFIFHK